MPIQPTGVFSHLVCDACRQSRLLQRSQQQRQSRKPSLLYPPRRHFQMMLPLARHRHLRSVSNLPYFFCRHTKLHIAYAISKLCFCYAFAFAVPLFLLHICRCCTMPCCTFAVHTAATLLDGSICFHQGLTTASLHRYVKCRP